MTGLHVLYVSTARSWRGGEQQLAYLFEELQKKGIHQTILCPAGSELAQYCRKKDLRHATFPKRSAFDLAFARKIKKMVEEHHINLVNPHDSHGHTFCILSSLLFRMKKPIVLHRKVDYPVSPSRFSRFKYNYPQIRKIICISQEVQNVLSKSLKMPQKCVVINDGVDLHKFKKGKPDGLRQEFAIPADHLLIGNIAAITQQKDYFSFVNTAEKALKKNEKLHFFIIGNGAQRKEIQDLVHRKNLNDKISFTGFRSDIPEILPALDLLLFTSEKEGLGTTILDAFAAGVPVVATNAGGIPEIIKDGKNGLLAPVKNAEALAVQLLRLAENPGLRKTLLNTALEDVQSYSKERMAEKTLDVFREVVREKHP